MIEGNDVAGRRPAIGTGVPWRSVARAELVKLRSLRSTFYLFAGTVLLVVGFGARQSWGIAATRPAPAPGSITANVAMGATLWGVTFGAVLLAVLAVLMVTGEYATGLIRTTFTAVPRRELVVAGKAVALLAVGVFAVAPTVLVTFLVSQQMLGPDLAPSLADADVLRALAGAVWYLVALGLLGQAFGWLLRNTVAAGLALIGALAFLPVASALLLPVTVQEHVFRYLPSEAGASLMRVDPSPHALGPGAGFLTLTAYAAAALALAAWTVRRRDA